jgi:hypothetical protein
MVWIVSIYNSIAWTSCGGCSTEDKLVLCAWVVSIGTTIQHGPVVAAVVLRMSVISHEPVVAAMI